MISKHYLFTVLTIAVLQNEINAWCIPCPKEGLSFTDFMNCDCSLPKFYDESSEECVDVLKCPSIPSFTDALPELKHFSPYSFDVFPKIPKFSTPQNVSIPKEFTLIVKAINKYIHEVRKNSQRLINPIFGPVFFENQDVLSSCKGNFGCMMRGIFKKKNNYNLIFPKLDNVLNEILKILRGVFDDLEKNAKEVCDEKDDCPFLEGILKGKDLLPRNVEEIKDLHQIFKQLNKYLLEDSENEEEKSKK